MIDIFFIEPIVTFTLQTVIIREESKIPIFFSPLSCSFLSFASHFVVTSSAAKLSPALLQKLLQLVRVCQEILLPAQPPTPPHRKQFFLQKHEKQFTSKTKLNCKCQQCLRGQI